MNALNFLSNLPGWRTKRKIIVLESDDWGSLRAPSKEALIEMQKLKLPLGKKEGIRFNKYDDLADQSDLENLFEVLHSVKDSNGYPVKMTALSLVANPDFFKIKESMFNEYHYEPFTKTLERQNKSSAFNLWQQGYKANIFIPEFHGREHLNVNTWMRDLRDDDEVTKKGFEYNFWGFRQKPNSISYQAAFDLELQSDLKAQKGILSDGLKLFKQLHQRPADYFVPPNGAINTYLEKVLVDGGIKFIMTSKIQREPLGDNKFKKHLKYLGKRNKYRQVYLTRNAFFEPNNPQKTDWVDACLKQIELAFRCNKPAIISTHRVNYIGCHDPKNRDESLFKLKHLLRQIKIKWPDIEFMSSAELGSVINQ